VTGTDRQRETENQANRHVGKLNNIQTSKKDKGEGKGERERDYLIDNQINR
jgi:hypothetical protein